MPRRVGPLKVRQYTLEFKLKAVNSSQLQGVEVQAVADALEIHPFMLSRRKGRNAPDEYPLVLDEKRWRAEFHRCVIEMSKLSGGRLCGGPSIRLEEFV